MLHSYAVELLTGASGTGATEIVTTQVQAVDRYEAVALARRFVEQQHPQVNLASIDTWFVARRID